MTWGDRFRSEPHIFSPDSVVDRETGRSFDRERPGQPPTWLHPDVELRDRKNGERLVVKEPTFWRERELRDAKGRVIARDRDGSLGRTAGPASSAAAGSDTDGMLILLIAGALCVTQLWFHYIVFVHPFLAAKKAGTAKYTSLTIAGCVVAAAFWAAPGGLFIGLAIGGDSLQGFTEASRLAYSAVALALLGLGALAYGWPAHLDARRRGVGLGAPWIVATVIALTAGGLAAVATLAVLPHRAPTTTAARAGGLASTLNDAWGLAATAAGPCWEARSVSTAPSSIHPAGQAPHPLGGAPERVVFDFQASSTNGCAGSGTPQVRRISVEDGRVTSDENLGAFPRSPALPGGWPLAAEEAVSSSGFALSQPGLLSWTCSTDATVIANCTWIVASTGSDGRTSYVTIPVQG